MYLEYIVAPLVGAWIEIFEHCRNGKDRLVVAPLVGAWIEITGCLFPLLYDISRSSCRSVD